MGTSFLLGLAFFFFTKQVLEEMRGSKTEWYGEMSYIQDFTWLLCNP